MAILKVADLRTARRYMQLAGGFRLGREYRIRRQALLSWIEHRELDAERPAPGAQTPRQAPSRRSRRLACADQGCGTLSAAGCDSRRAECCSQ